MKNIFNDYLSFYTGFYGEAIPFDSGMTVAVKSHGFTTGKNVLKAVDIRTSEATRKTLNHIKELNQTAILLVRNPFKAIIGHRFVNVNKPFVYVFC